MAAVINLSSGAISKISTGKCTENNLHPVLQVTSIDNKLPSSIQDKQWYGVLLSDGSFFQLGLVVEEVFISNELQIGSIVQLTKFQLNRFQLAKPVTNSKGDVLNSKSVILCFDLIVIHSKCGIIGHPKLYLEIETPLVERTIPAMPDEDRANSHHVEEPPTSKRKHDHIDSLLNEDVDDVKQPPTSIHNPSTSAQHCSSHFPTSKQKQDHVDPDLLQNIDDSRHVEEPPTSKHNPSTSTQKCSSHTSTQNKKQKPQSSDDAISEFGKYMSDVMNLIVEKTIEDGLCPCHRKLVTLEEDVSKLTRMVMEKNKADDVGACFKKLETLEEDVSKLTRMMMDKSKEDDMGACIEKLDKMGWGAESPMYDTALLLFGQSADYRKLWLHLKPESCGKWVKNAGNMFGLLD